MVSDSSIEDFGFVVVFANDDYSPSFGISFSNKGQKKTSVFECEIDFDKALAKVRLKGSFQSDNLRAGVKEIIINEFSEKPIYLQGLTFKGGEWKGFRGDVDGQDGENYSGAMKFDNWSVK